MSDQNYIAGFFKEYRFLSNFHDAQAAYDGVVYPTSEHAFQAAKTFDLDEREAILNCQTPGESKKMGRSVKLRKDWEKVKIPIMFNIVLDKFTRNEEIRKKLLETEDKILIEENNWGDKFWGQVEGIGQNQLGKILMTVRSLLK